MDNQKYVRPDPSVNLIWGNGEPRHLTPGLFAWQMWDDLSGVLSCLGGIFRILVWEAYLDYRSECKVRAFHEECDKKLNKIRLDAAQRAQEHTEYIRKLLPGIKYTYTSNV